MKKNYNTPEYRDSKRVVAFIEPEIKKKVLSQAKKNGLSISAELKNVIDAHYSKVK